MGELINFPIKESTIDRLLSEAVERKFGDNPPLSKCMESVAIEMTNLVNFLQRRSPTFSFISTNDSISENREFIEEAVREMSSEYQEVIHELLTQLLNEKMDNCKRVHDEEANR